MIYRDARGHHPEFAGLGGVKQAANSNGPDILAPMIRAVVQSRLLTNNYRAMSDPYSASGFPDDRKLGRRVYVTTRYFSAFPSFYTFLLFPSCQAIIDLFSSDEHKIYALYTNYIYINERFFIDYFNLIIIEIQLVFLYVLKFIKFVILYLIELTLLALARKCFRQCLFHILKS